MKNNKQVKDWFASPFPINPSQFTNDRLNNFLNKQNQLDQSMFFKSHIFAPNTPCLPLFAQSPQKNNTPWSGNIKEDQYQKFKIQEFNYQNSNASGECRDNAIGLKLNFNQEQFEIQSQKQSQQLEMNTPIKRGKQSLFEEYLKQQDDLLVDTTAKKSEFNDSNSAKKGRPKQKGLRKLSQRAFQIVLTLKSVTYKDVATLLVQELKQSNQLENQVADQQNVKRRVYDSLNVLIASRVLKRDGRKIKLQKRQNECSQQQKIIYMQELRNSLILRKFRIKEKRKKKSQISKKFGLIKLLMKRNKQIDQSSKLINFPFIGALTQQIKQDNIQFQTRKQFSICVKEPMPFGDIDSIIYLQNSLTQK